MLIVGPDCPDQLKPLMLSIVDAITALQQPAQPVRLGRVLTAATLPSATTYAEHAILVRDKQCVAISTLVGSAWTWLRADGSAL